MIRVYFLPVITQEGTESVVCADLIHDALLLCTEQPDRRKLIMDTTDVEHTQLADAAEAHRDATQEEIDLFNSSVILYTPDPDTLRAEELLQSSPAVITQPEQWELMRIFGRRLGYRF